MDTLEGIGIVAHPEFVEPREDTVVRATAARSAGLDGQIRILCSDPVAYCRETAMIFDVKMALLVLRQVLRSMVDNGHVRIPLDVIDARVLGHEVVHDLEDVVLDFRIREVKHQLSTSTAGHDVSFRSLDHPVRMLVVKLADAVGHLWFDPYSEADSMNICTLYQPADSVRKLVPVDLPVSKRAVVGQTRIFLAEPSVIHHEEFASHVRDIGHHLVHSRLVNVEINAFPAVQKDLARLVSMGDLIVSGPSVEVAAGTAQSLFRIGESQFRSLEDLLGRKAV